MRRSDMDAALRGVYEQIPALDCRGLCHTSCGPVSMSLRERQRMRQQGVKVEALPPDALREAARGGSPVCPALTAERRCGVYEIRPAICRLWGAMEDMPCPYGCRPVDGGALLPTEEALRLLAESLAAGGDPGFLGGVGPEDLARELKERPWLKSLVLAVMGRGRAHGV